MTRIIMTRIMKVTGFVAAALLAGCGDQVQPLAPVEHTAIVTAAQISVVDISGAWNYAETSVLVIKPGGEVLQIICFSPDGVLTIDQNGSTFTGTLTHPTSICEMKDGQVVPAPWPLPYEATLSGRITGRGIHIDQFDAPPAPPVHCPKQGAIEVTGGEAVGLRTTGRCDLSFLPFRPATARNSATATRP